MVDGWSMVVEYKTIDHHITIIPTIHYTHWWSSGRFLRRRVCVRERIQRIAPLFHATPLDTIPTTSRQFTNNVTFTENTKRR